MRNKAGRQETEREVLFSADFTSAEVYNKVSADHSPLKALTNNTPVHGKWIKPVPPHTAAGEHRGTLWFPSRRIPCLVLHNFFLLFSVKHIWLLRCFCVHCVPPPPWKRFIRRKGFQKLVRLIDLDQLLELALWIQKKALIKEPGLQKHPLCHLFPKQMGEGGAQPMWAPWRAAWRWSRALEGPAEALN